MNIRQLIFAAIPLSLLVQEANASVMCFTNSDCVYLPRQYFEAINGNLCKRVLGQSYCPLEIDNAPNPGCPSYVSNPGPNPPEGQPCSVTLPGHAGPPKKK